MTETHTVVSYNRPLTRGARDALDEYGIVDTESVNEHGRWTVVTLEDRPPGEVLDEHELKLDRDPDRVYRTDNGETVEIYPDAVVVDGIENTITPEEAIDHAESEGWDREE